MIRKESRVEREREREREMTPIEIKRLEVKERK